MDEEEHRGRSLRKEEAMVGERGLALLLRHSSNFLGFFFLSVNFFFFFLFSVVQLNSVISACAWDQKSQVHNHGPISTHALGLCRDFSCGEKAG
jgi:hypothetical protein